jgi:hypothetical protein
MTEEAKTQAVYESKVLKRIQNVSFHTCKASTYKARKFQVRIAKEYMQQLVADLPEDAQALTGSITEAIEKYATFTSWVTVEFLNSNNKLKDAWDYQASVVELVQYSFNGEKGLTMNLCGKVRDVQSEQMKKRMRLK